MFHIPFKNVSLCVYKNNFQVKMILKKKSNNLLLYYIISTIFFFYSYKAYIENRVDHLHRWILRGLVPLELLIASPVN